MKLIIPVLVCLFSLNCMGQKNPEYPERYRRFVNPDTLKLFRHTSLVGWLNSLKLKSDSLHLSLRDSIRRGKGFPDMQQRKKNQDAMVLNLPPFPDKMPNAHVVTPGVHYQLKILSPKKNSQLIIKEIPPKEPDN